MTVNKESSFFPNVWRYNSMTDEGDSEIRSKHAADTNKHY
jgi:hypothetical protein